MWMAKLITHEMIAEAAQSGQNPGQPDAQHQAPDEGHEGQPQRDPEIDRSVRGSIDRSVRGDEREEDDHQYLD